MFHLELGTWSDQNSNKRSYYSLAGSPPIQLKGTLVEITEAGLQMAPARVVSINPATGEPFEPSIAS